MRREIIDYADHAPGVLATSAGRLNPYKLGVELYRNIEERWNKGQFGKEWEECDDLDAKKNWDLRLGLGKKKIFEVRALYNDVTFIDEFLTPDFCREQKLFTFGVVEPQRALRDRDARVQGGEGEAPLPAHERAATRSSTSRTRTSRTAASSSCGTTTRGSTSRRTTPRRCMRSLVRVWKRPVNVHDGRRGQAGACSATTARSTRRGTFAKRVMARRMASSSAIRRTGCGRLSPDEWIRAALGELARAEEAYARERRARGARGVQARGGDGAQRRAHRRAERRVGADVRRARRRRSRSDAAVPEAVRAACDVLARDARRRAAIVLSLRTHAGDASVLEAARDVIAHAYAVVKRHEALRAELHVALCTCRRVRRRAQRRGRRNPPPTAIDDRRSITAPTSTIAGPRSRRRRCRARPRPRRRETLPPPKPTTIRARVAPRATPSIRSSPTATRRSSERARRGADALRRGAASSAPKRAGPVGRARARAHRAESTRRSTTAPRRATRR